MKSTDRKSIKELLLKSASQDDFSEEQKSRAADLLPDYDFSSSFDTAVLNGISRTRILNPEYDFVRSMNSMFYRIALSGAAAIIVLLVSIYLSEGNLSLKSLVGISDNYNDGIVYLLTGN